MAAGNQKATAEFVPLLNVYYNRWKGGGGPTCIGVTDVGIGGPTGGYTGTTYSFTAHVTPTGATAPFTYTWAPAPTSGQGALSAQYTWPVTGAKTITLTVANCGGSDAATHVITIDPRPVARIAIYLPLVLRNYTSTPPTCPVPLTGVAISGPVSGVTNTTYVFTATPIPVNATQPVAYTWSPDPESGQGTVSARYRWETAGSKSLYVAAGNCGGGTNTATAHHTITLQGASPGDLIYPADFTYLGAFRLPDEASGDISWSYGGIGMTYYPHGDPASTDDYPGSLFSISDYPFNNYVSEFSIPVPVVSAHKNLADLPMATTLQPFADITNGRQEPGLTGLAVVDVQYYPQQGAQTSDKLYWVMFEYYMPEDEFGHGWSELTLSAPQAQGAWRLGDFPTAGVNKYLFEIPTAWADAYTPGLYLAAGRARIPNNGSWGPALHAFGPWNDGNPPASGSSVAATQMVYYAYDYDNYISDHMARDYSHADEWQDGAWLTVGDRSAVMLAGVKGLRREYELEYYGDDNVDACGNSKGWHAEPYYAAVLFYDPALLAASVQGEIEPYEIQPYAMLNLEDYMFQQGCRRQTLGGVGYDRERRLVYVLEREVLADGGKPIVHVFQLSATAHSADLTPPTAPTNVQATPTAAQVALTWNAASDNAHLAGYILYRFGEPIATTPATTYTDDKVNPGATYTYTVVAWDASNNLSAPAAVVATTPAGADERVPVIYAIKYSGLDDTGLTVRWQTDEPATTVLTYEVAYSGDMQVYQNATLTRRHEVVLTDLTPETNYFVWAVVGADAAGHTNIFHLENWDFYTAPTGETRNFRPVLNGIGSRRVMLGETVAFTLEALDRDSDDTLTFSAVDLPAGATLHPTTGQFSWTPSTAGTTRITFSVSDGDQVDSERVTIFVAASSR